LRFVHFHAFWVRSFYHWKSVKLGPLVGDIPCYCSLSAQRMSSILNGDFRGSKWVHFQIGIQWNLSKKNW
jgi:hypothetical protein